MEIALFFLGHWYLSLFGQTFFLHRYAAHKMFTLSKFWEKFFYIFAWVTAGSSSLSAYAYSVMHREHHAYSDTEKDPHSPHFFKGLWALIKMMWYTKAHYQAILNGTAVVKEEFKKNIPSYPVIDKLSDSWASRLTFAGLYISFYVIFATHWWMYLLLPIHFVMSPIHGAIVNWAGHKYGYRNFELNDKSTNAVIALDFLMLGELFQNNHHKRAAQANFGSRWFEVDPVYPIIRIFDFLQIIKLNTR